MSTRLEMHSSKVSDGSMKRGGDDAELIDANRQRFLKSHGTSAEYATLVQLDYNSTDFRRYDEIKKIDSGEGIVRPGRIADALVTKALDVTLFLPLADCIGAVIYSQRDGILMLSHLGRHNLLQSGGIESIEFLIRKFSLNPNDLHVFLSPSAGKTNYPLFDFSDRSMQDVAIDQLTIAGVLSRNIVASSIDTTTDKTYFSHSEFLKGNRSTDGRFALIATLRGA